MLKPICVNCQRFYRPKRTGFYFLEGMPKPGINDPEPGTAEADKWQPYKLWCGDLWHCLGCGHQIVVGSGQRPIAEHYADDFSGYVKSTGADQLQVNDC